MSQTNHNAETSEAQPQPEAGREVVITRTFDAPRELVFKAWTDPRHFLKLIGVRRIQVDGMRRRLLLGVGGSDQKKE